MFKKLLESTVSEVKNPERRLNIIMLIIAVSALCAVIVFQDRSKDEVNINAIIFLQHQNELKDRKIDSLTIKIYVDKSEANKEEIDRLKDFVNNQNEQKKLWRTKKK